MSSPAIKVIQKTDNEGVDLPGKVASWFLQISQNTRDKHFNADNFYASLPINSLHQIQLNS